MQLTARYMVPLVNILITLVILGSLKKTAGNGTSRIITKRINSDIAKDIDALAELPVPFLTAIFQKLEESNRAQKSKILDKATFLKNSERNNVKVSHCRKNDTIVRNACSEYCTQLKHYDEGECSQDESSCVCSTLGAAPIKVKLFIPQSSVKRNPTPASSFPTKSTRLSVSKIGKFPCDHSLSAESICRVFCETKANGSFHSECSSDQTSCLCLTFQNTKFIRKQREISDGIEETIIVTPPPVVSLVADTIRRQMRPMRRRVVGNPMSPGQPLLACTPFSCYNNCPLGCDSLCTANLQCFCSCPEDEMSFDYFDPGYGPRPGMFFNY